MKSLKVFTPSFLCIVLFMMFGVVHADLRDPTRPPGYAADSNPNPWELNAIFSSSDRKIAVINGVSVKEGDTIGNAKVTSINENSVVIDGSEGKMTLNLGTASIKTDVK